MYRKPKAHFSRTLEAAILAVAILIVLAIGTLSYFNAAHTRRRVVQLRMTRDIQKLNTQLLVEVTNAETGQRGFLLTGQDRYLQPYNRATSAIPEILRHLESRAAPVPDQAQRIRAVHSLIAAKLAELKETVDLGRSKNMTQAVANVRAGRGEALMEDIRARCSEINQVAEARVAEFNAASDLSTLQLRIGSSLGSVLLLGLVFLSAIIISRGFQRREELIQEAQATRELLATTLSSIADAVISTDAEARITFMNPVAAQLTGWKAQAASGRRVTEVFSIAGGTSNDKVANPLDRALTQVEAVSLENPAKLMACDGREIFIDESAARIRDADGQVIGAVLVFRDVSEKRRSELDLAESAAALKRSNEELQQFAFAASHDLRSPLNSVNSIAQLLARRFGQALGRDGNEMIGYITEGVGRMSRLVEDLLALALASRMAEDVTRPTSMEDAFQAALQGLSAEIQKSGAAITSTTLPLVAAHTTHVVQVMQNILGNALKYRGTETPRIEVSAARDGAEWIVSVKDNGIGFEAKYADQIFQPFKRLHGHEYEGSGIGLSTCKKIVSVYGGRIWAVAEPGKGATFFFTLPAWEAVGIATHP